MLASHDNRMPLQETDMKVADLMTNGAATVRPDASLAEAARIMVEHRISGLPVVDASGRLVGIVTEGDFLRRADQDRPRWISVLLSDPDAHITAKQLHDRRVEEAMSPEPITVDIDGSVDEVVELMERHDVKRVPVVCDGKVMGMVSRADLLRALTRSIGRRSGSRADQD
jgi:CBS domain-containing protein